MLTEQKSGTPKKLVKSREYSNESTALTKKHGESITISWLQN